MNQLQVFENELFKVSAKNDNGQILFDVEQVVKCLEIAQIKNKREDICWERVNEYLPSNYPNVGKGDLIPEPLVYKLAFKASNDVALKFQDWLAIEVIPSIRKIRNSTSHSKERALLTVLRTTAELVNHYHAVVKQQHEIRRLITHVDQKVEEQITLDHSEQRRLQKAVALKVYELSDNPQDRRKLFSEIYREMKARFGVTSYKDVRRKELQSAIRYVESFVPRKVVS